MNFLKPLGNCFKIIKTDSFHIDRFLYKRMLFTAESKNIPNFLLSQKNVRQIVQDKEKYKQEMRDLINSESGSIIISDDLKKMLFLAEDDDDLLLVHDMAKNLSAQHNIIRFQSYNFGPELMRLHCVLKKPKEAIALFEDPNTFQLFKQPSSLLIFMDLLFEEQMYDEFLRMYELIRERQVQGRKYFPNLVLLYYGSLYKLNTEESFQKGLAHWSEMMSNNYRPTMRTTIFFSCLAYNQGHFATAIEAIALIRHFLSFNMKAKTFAKLKRYEDVLYTLQNCVNDDSSYIGRRNIILEETLNCVEEAFKDLSMDLKARLEDIKKSLRAADLIVPQPLEYFLFKEVEYGKEHSTTIQKPAYRKHRYTSRM